LSDFRPKTSQAGGVEHTVAGRFSVLKETLRCFVGNAVWNSVSDSFPAGLFDGFKNFTTNEPNVASRGAGQAYESSHADRVAPPLFFSPRGLCQIVLLLFGRGLRCDQPSPP
jgi:hypothetical protein